MGTKYKGAVPMPQGKIKKITGVPMPKPKIKLKYGLLNALPTFQHFMIG